MDTSLKQTPSVGFWYNYSITVRQLNFLKGQLVLILPVFVVKKVGRACKNLLSVKHVFHCLAAIQTMNSRSTIRILNRIIYQLYSINVAGMLQTARKSAII